MITAFASVVRSNGRSDGDVVGNLLNGNIAFLHIDTSGVGIANHHLVSTILETRENRIEGIFRSVVIVHTNNLVLQSSIRIGRNSVNSDRTVEILRTIFVTSSICIDSNIVTIQRNVDRILSHTIGFEFESSHSVHTVSQPVEGINERFIERNVIFMTSSIIIFVMIMFGIRITRSHNGDSTIARFRSSRLAHEVSS